MATYSTEFLSGSTNGRPIKVVATATPGTTIHTAHATSKDMIWLWCANTDTNDIKLTIEKGGTTSPDDTIEVTIPAESGLILVLPGTPLSNSLVVKAFGGSANLLIIDGYVSRVT